MNILKVSVQTQLKLFLYTLRWKCES